MFIKLIPIKREDFEIWASESRKRFAEDKTKYNNLTKEEADKVALEIFNKILPDGFDSKDNFIYFVTSSESEKLGYLWYCLRGTGENKKAWVCDVRIEEGFRGKGLGRQTMLLLEEDVKKKNIRRISLHVFAYNKAAVNLYRSLDYSTTDLSMEKSL